MCTGRWGPKGKPGGTGHFCWGAPRRWWSLGQAWRWTAQSDRSQMGLSRAAVAGLGCTWEAAFEVCGVMGWNPWARWQMAELACPRASLCGVGSGGGLSESDTLSGPWQGPQGLGASVFLTAVGRLGYLRVRGVWCVQCGVCALPRCVGKWRCVLGEAGTREPQRA